MNLKTLQYFQWLISFFDFYREFYIVIDLLFTISVAKSINFNLFFLYNFRAIAPQTTAPWKTVPRNFHPGQLPPGQFPQTTPTWDYCVGPQIITPGQLLPWAMAIENYSFSMAIFFFCFFLANYIISVFCFDNKNNKVNSNKTWSLKLLSIMGMMSTIFPFMECSFLNKTVFPLVAWSLASHLVNQLRYLW